MEKPFLSSSERRAQAPKGSTKYLTFHRPLFEASQLLGISKKQLLERMYEADNRNGTMDGVMNIVAARDLDSHFTLEVFGEDEGIFAYLVPNDFQSRIDYYFEIDTRAGKITRVSREDKAKKARESSEGLLGGWTVDLS